jgi:arginase family enzyme
MEKKVKVFGAALDATDFPLNVQTKLVYLNRIAQNAVPEPNFLDPYEGLLLFSEVLSNDKYLKIGKLPVDSWLTPKPTIQDYPLITQEEFQKFANDGLVKDYSNKIENYIQKNILPDVPIMIGADHSLTGGSLSALSKEYGAENILVVIFDAHYDGIPANIALNIAKYMKDHPDEVNPLVPELVSSVEENSDIKDTYTCASFLNYLMKDKIILPDNLIVFGCQDYPDEEYRSIKDPRIVEFVDFFNSIEKEGVTFIPKMKSTQMIQKLSSKLEKFDKPYIYISFDVDVGGLKEIIAARFRNAIGIEKSTILDAAEVIKKKINSSKCKLIGLDIMEIETHLLNRDFPKSGRKDLTVEVVDDFLEILI